MSDWRRAQHEGMIQGIKDIGKMFLIVAIFFFGYWMGLHQTLGSRF